MYEFILHENRGPTALITLNRPEVLNALTLPMLAEIRHAFQQAEADPEVVGILLTGAGRGFCAGMDMNALSSQANQTSNTDAPDGEPGARFDFTSIPAMRKPLIVAVNGPCAGLGMSIALWGDLRFATAGANFITAFARRGLVAEHGQSWILPRLVGASRALDLLWSSRKLGADEALRLGLVDRVFNEETLLDESCRYIEQLAENCSPTSLMVMKRQVYGHLNMQLQDAMRETEQLMAESLKGEDFREGVNSFMEKRPPAFKRLDASAGRT